MFLSVVAFIFPFGTCVLRTLNSHSLVVLYSSTVNGHCFNSCLAALVYAFIVFAPSHFMYLSLESFLFVCLDKLVSSQPLISKHQRGEDHNRAQHHW